MTKRIKIEVETLHEVTTAEETAKFARVFFPITLTMQNALISSIKVLDWEKAFHTVEWGFRKAPTGRTFSVDFGHLLPQGREGGTYKSSYQWIGNFITPLNVSDIYIVVFNPTDTELFAAQGIYEVLN